MRRQCFQHYLEGIVNSLFNKANKSITSNCQKIVMRTMLVALLPLLALGMSERVQNDQEEKELNRYKIHQEDDFRAPDFDLSQLKVGGMNFQIYFGLSKVLFSGTAEVPGCPEEHQHLTVYE